MSTKKRFVPFSTPQSRDNKQISILAIAETICMVCATWFAAWYFDSSVHIIAAILIAPFLLLKTPASIDQGIRWFLYEWEPTTSQAVIWISLPTVMITGVISWYLAEQWLIGETGWALFAYAFGIGILSIVVAVAIAMAIAGAGAGAGEITTAAAVRLIVGATATAAIGVIVGGVVGIVGIAGIVVGGIIVVAVVAVGVIVEVGVGVGVGVGVEIGVVGIVSPAFVVGFIIRSVIVKFAVTLIHLFTHPLQIWQAIATNYFEQIAVNDICYSPELLPDIHKQNASFSAFGAFKETKAGDWYEKYFAVIVGFCWLPAYLYRFSIKSTAWLYWPLAYLSKFSASKDAQHSIFVDIRSQVILYPHIAFTVFALSLIGLNTDALKDYPWVQFIIVNKNLLIDKLPSFAPDSYWLVIAAIICYFMVYVYASLVKHRSDEGIDTPVNVFVVYCAKAIICFWYAFFIWNWWSIFNNDAWDYLLSLWFGFMANIGGIT